jgi:hypothetical protein
MDTLKQFNLAMQYIETHLTETIDFQLVAQVGSRKKKANAVD